MTVSIANLELLAPEQHKNVRLRPLGDKPHFVQIVTSEFGAAAACCPVLFTKEAQTGNFFAGALFAFKPGESYLHDSIERGAFTPLSVQRDGFFIAGEQIAIDRSNPRFSETEGEPLFDGANQPSVALRRIQRTLGQLKAGIETTEHFIRALAELKLIEPIDITLNFDTGDEQLTLQGLYTVSLDGLQQLAEGAAIRLLRSGYLQLAYTMSASLEQLPALARVRDRAIRKSLSVS